jgi:hypothetical protein
MSEAITILKESPPEHSFKLAKTTIEIKNLSELAEAFEVMSDESFSHHVSETKNDFAAWVKDVLHDEELSNKLIGVSDKHKALQLVKHRLKETGSPSHYTYISNLFGFGLWDIIIGFVAGLVIGLFLGHFLIPKF